MSVCMCSESRKEMKKREKEIQIGKDDEATAGYLALDPKVSAEESTLSGFEGTPRLAGQHGARGVVHAKKLLFLYIDIYI